MCAIIQRVTILLAWTQLDKNHFRENSLLEWGALEAVIFPPKECRSTDDLRDAHLGCATAKNSLTCSQREAAPSCFNEACYSSQDSSLGTSANTIQGEDLHLTSPNTHAWWNPWVTWCTCTCSAVHVKVRFLWCDKVFDLPPKALRYNVLYVQNVISEWQCPWLWAKLTMTPWCKAFLASPQGPLEFMPSGTWS